MFSLPDLSYEYDALESQIDARTMEIHHTKHHQGYVDKLNAALEGHADLAEKSLEELLGDIDALPAEIQTAVRNNGGGHANHSLFWTILTPGGAELEAGDLKDAIEEKFGSIEKFQDEFTMAAGTRFGSGWAWLVLDADGDLQVYSTANQDSPLMEGDTPLLGLDVWEHAYYLNYQNKRPDYIQAFWQIVNWPEVAQRYSQAK